jgi:hypothetical protein
LNAYDLNFFIKTFDLGHEHFLMNADARRLAAQLSGQLGFKVPEEDGNCLAPLQAMCLGRPWSKLHARKIPSHVGGSLF